MAVLQKEVRKQREGNVVADVLGFYRETHTTSWKFQGLLLLKEGIVISRESARSCLGVGCKNRGLQARVAGLAANV